MITLDLLPATSSDVPRRRTIIANNNNIIFSSPRETSLLVSMDPNILAPPSSLSSSPSSSSSSLNAPQQQNQRNKIPEKEQERLQPTCLDGLIVSSSDASLARDALSAEDVIQRQHLTTTFPIISKTAKGKHYHQQQQFASLDKCLQQKWNIYEKVRQQQVQVKQQQQRIQQQETKQEDDDEQIKSRRRRGRVVRFTLPSKPVPSFADIDTVTQKMNDTAISSCWYTARELHALAKRDRKLLQEWRQRHLQTSSSGSFSSMHPSHVQNNHNSYNNSNASLLSASVNAVAAPSSSSSSPSIGLILPPDQHTDEDSDWCLRGLEDVLSIRAGLEARKRKLAVRRAVLDEQARQRQERAQPDTTQHEPQDGSHDHPDPRDGNNHHHQDGKDAQAARLRKVSRQASKASRNAALAMAHADARYIHRSQRSACSRLRHLRCTSPQRLAKTAQPQRRSQSADSTLLEAMMELETAHTVRATATVAATSINNNTLLTDRLASTVDRITLARQSSAPPAVTASSLVRPRRRSSVRRREPALPVQPATLARTPFSEETKNNGQLLFLSPSPRPHSQLPGCSFSPSSPPSPLPSFSPSP